MSTVVILSVGVAFAVVLPVAWRVRQGRFDPFEPIVVFVLAWGVMFVVRPLAIAIRDDTNFYGVDIEPTLDEAVLLGLVGAVAFVVGYETSSGAGSRHEPRPPRLRIAPTPRWSGRSSLPVSGWSRSSSSCSGRVRRRGDVLRRAQQRAERAHRRLVELPLVRIARRGPRGADRGFRRAVRPSCVGCRGRRPARGPRTRSYRPDGQSCLPDRARRRHCRVRVSSASATAGDCRTVRWPPARATRVECGADVPLSGDSRQPRVGVAQPRLDSNNGSRAAVRGAGRGDGARARGRADRRPRTVAVPIRGRDDRRPRHPADSASALGGEARDPGPGGRRRGLARCRRRGCFRSRRSRPC